MSEKKKTPRDPRTEIIPAIWGISIPIIAIGSVFGGHSGPIVPVLAIIGATISSCVVWLTGKQPVNTGSPELEQVVVQLSQRVAQLEIELRDVELRTSIQQAQTEITTSRSQPAPPQ